MLVDVTQNQSHDVTAFHESALQEATLRITNEVDAILAALGAAIASSTSLHREIVSYLCIFYSPSPDLWLGNLAVRGCSSCVKAGEYRDGTLPALAPVQNPNS